MLRTRGFGLEKWIVILGIVAAVGAVSYFVLKRNNQAAPSYQTAPVTRGDLTQSVTATGTLNPVLNVQVGSQVSGNIQKLFADWNS
ncbi:MAG: efflux RND transporter periplasmic adaptor subunit, partial [Verrucomicrobiota bacterium]